MTIYAGARPATQKPTTSTSTSRVWYAIPSANPQRARACVEMWAARGYRTAVLFDEGSPTAAADLVVVARHYPGYFQSVNDLCRLIGPAASIVVTGGDDMEPDPHHTAEQLEAQFLERFPDGFGVMQPIGDSLAGTAKICGSPWLGHGWIKRAYGGNGPLPGCYRQFYGDEELRHVATSLGVLWDRLDLVQRHNHPCREGGPKPTEYQQMNSARYWHHDKATYQRRQQASWPGHVPLEATR